MWSEVVDDVNIVQRIFPRVSAMAEKLWSPLNASTVDEARYRMEEHYCRMQNRGIPAQPPNHAGYCLHHAAPESSGVTFSSGLWKFIAILIGFKFVLTQ